MVMDDVAGECGAVLEAVVFLKHFSDLPDPRQRGKVMYPLDEVLLLCLLAVLAGADTFVDIARFGEKKIDLLRRFRPFRDGTPSHDHLGDIFATLDAAHFQRCFVSWVASLTGVPDGVIAVDGKTSRRSYQGKGAKAPIHMVSAVSGAKPRAACIFPLPPTRAGTIRLVHVTARRSAWPASPRVGSARGGAVWRGGRAEAAGGGATRRDRTTEGPQGSPGDQAKRHGGSDQAKAGRQAGQAPRPWQGDAAGHARDQGDPGGGACGLAVQGLRAVSGAGPSDHRAGGVLPPRALADAGGRYPRSAAARRHPRSFRAGAAPLRADAVSPGAGDRRAAGRAAPGRRRRHLQAPGHAPADRQAGRLESV